MDPVEIVALSGSLRKGSFNTALLRAAVDAPGDGDDRDGPRARLSLHTLAGVPVYDGDVEAEGIPEPVEALKDAIAAADGLLLASPEYNNSIPGPLKNAIDWCTRPPADIRRVFGGKPVALCGATPGRFGTALAQTAWLPVLRTVGAELWPRKLMVSSAGDAFDEDGGLRDEKLAERLRDFVAGFAAFCAERRSG